jgi:hypothetical protein
VPVHALLHGGWLLRGIFTGAFYALPLFFAGVIFSTSLGEAANIESAFAANLTGAGLGGMLESLSFLTGLRAIVLVAVGLYLASALAWRKEGRKQ